ncbi:MAG: fibronectin type III domain-containing protein [Methanomassiliicoccales archaeon]|nr:fibronectin type III domain-containing protein [Methanomassiliicoccales archaeon]
MVRKATRAAILVLMVLSSMSFIVIATDTVTAETYGDFEYRLINDGTEVEITRYNGLEGHVEIPSVIDGEPVTSIGNYSFLRASMTSVIIPNSVKSIGDSAFYACNYLTSLTIPNGVLSIGIEAFFRCSSLSNVTIPSSVTSIGVLAFNRCNSLLAIAVDESSTNYASLDGILYNKTLATLLQCPSGKVGALTIPYGVASIGDGAFYFCIYLTSITIPNGVTSIGLMAFYQCSSLTSVTIGCNVTTIGDCAFYNCDSLTSLTIPDCVIAIGNHAFSGCSSLTSLTIPDSVTSIGSFAFSRCTSLIAINVETRNANYASVDGTLFNKTITTLLRCPEGKAGAVTIPSSVKSIGDSALYGCAALTSVTIPDGVTSIGIYAFSGCTSLTSLIVPDSVTSIGILAFNQCSSLTSVTIGSSVRSIGDWVFSGCNNLTSIMFLGLIAPAFVGISWIGETGAGILGHAYAASNFPAPGEVWNGLTMGEVIPVIPGVPTDLVATAGDGKVTLTWNPPISNGGSAITSYKVYRGTVSENETLLVILGNVQTYNDTGLNNSHTYYYLVSAVSSVGEGAPAGVSATPIAKSDDTLFFVGIGLVAIIVIIAAAILMFRRKK